VLDLNDFQMPYLRLISKRNWSTRVSKSILDKIATAHSSGFLAENNGNYSAAFKNILTGALEC
jgi:hypothetical protein